MFIVQKIDVAIHTLSALSTIRRSFIKLKSKLNHIFFHVFNTVK